MSLPPPSFTSFPDLEPLPAADPSRNEKRRKREKREKREKRDKSPAVSSRSELKQRTDRVDAETHSTSRLFYSDRKGDPLNVQFGRLNSREVPKYYSTKVVLGLSSAYSAFRTSNGIEIGLPGRRHMPSLTDASSRTLLSRNPIRSFVNASASSSKYEEEDGFLRLPSRTVNQQAYRSIEKTNANSDSESDSRESDAGESSEEEETSSSHQTMLKTINERLAVEPHSIVNWLSLLSNTLLTIPTASKNATRARSEISISILSPALAATNNAPLLRLKYLQAGEDTWHESKLRAEWEDALRNSQSVDIWMGWLDWRIRNSSDGVSGLAEDARRAIIALRPDQVAQVRIFWRLAVAIQSAGFGEKATAMFQAQAEITFHLPPPLQSRSFSERLDLLEEFWESECPRIGETGAQGWASWLSSGRTSAPPPPQSRPPPLHDLDPYRKFAFAEALADRALFVPQRSIDMEADADPYATILFSDIRDVLLDLESRDAKDVLRHAWIAFMGLHLPGFPASLRPDELVDMHDRWCHTYLTRPTFLDGLFPARTLASRITNDSVAGTIVGRERKYTSGLECPVLSWGHGVVHPLAVLSAEGKSRSLWSNRDLEDIDTIFVGNLFSQLRLGNDDVDWDTLALCFACASNVKGALKLSRSFLATSPDSLFHWAAHGRLEQLRGRIDDARKVYETVLLSSSAMRPGAGQLWYDWAEMEWLANRSDAALKVILRCSGVESSGGVALLRTKRNLEDSLNAAKGQAREPWVKLRALLEVLVGSGPEYALQIFDNQLSQEEAGSSEHERLSVSALLMLYRHSAVLRNPMPPALLRERVETAVTLYPSNSVLLGLFLEGQKGQGMWGKVRAMLGEGGGAEKGVLRRVEEVWIAGWDTGRWEAELERTRSGLAAGADHERTRHSAILWRIFIEFEIRAGQLKRAKKLFFRAIGDCPLVKELYLVAFGPLRGVFSAQELNGIADTMAERGLRLRRGLEEFLDGWEEKEGGQSSDEDGDEIMQAADDYRMRLPY